MSIKVYGASDDLIEISGDIEEEFSLYDGEANVAFSDGTLLNIRYDTNGIWRIAPLAHGSGTLAIHQCAIAGEDEDCDEYTDVAILHALSGEKFKWVVVGGEAGRP